MSLYTFATSNFTTESDARRRAFIDRGQLIRTLALFSIFLTALILVASRSDAVEGGPHTIVETMWPPMPARSVVSASAAPRLHKSLPAARF